MFDIATWLNLRLREKFAFHFKWKIAWRLVLSLCWICVTWKNMVPRTLNILISQPSFFLTIIFAFLGDREWHLLTRFVQNTLYEWAHLISVLPFWVMQIIVDSFNSVAYYVRTKAWIVRKMCFYVILFLCGKLMDVLTLCAIWFEVKELYYVIIKW